MEAAVSPKKSTLWFRRLTSLVAVRKTPAKKSPVKKTPAKKSPVKKTPAKKTPAKKTPVKKTPARKTPARTIEEDITEVHQVEEAFAELEASVSPKKGTFVLYGLIFVATKAAPKTKVVKKVVAKTPTAPTRVTARRTTSKPVSYTETDIVTEVVEGTHL